MDNNMVHAPGSYRNPADKWCFNYCGSCGRCGDKGKFDACRNCSGRLDPQGMREEHQDDYCRCKEGILQWVTQKGRMVQVKFESNPFAGVVKHDRITDDEADWNRYLADAREALNDPDYDPIQFESGGSVNNYLEQLKNG